jgi:hypothetical protein
MQELARHDWTPMLMTGAALREHLAREQHEMGVMLAELGFANNHGDR